MFGAGPLHTARSPFVGPVTAAVGVWTPVATQGQVWSSPAVDAAGNVYIGSDDGSLYAINATGDSVLWKYTTGGHVRSSPALSADGSVVYVGSMDGYVYAVATDTGKQVCGCCCCGFNRWVAMRGTVAVVNSVLVVARYGTRARRFLQSPQSVSTPHQRLQTRDTSTSAATADMFLLSMLQVAK